MNIDYGYFEDEALVAAGTAQEEDTLEAGRAAGYPRVIFFNGLKNPLCERTIDERGYDHFSMTDDMARSMCIMLANAPRVLLDAAAAVLAMQDENGQPIAEKVYVAHENKRAKDGYVYKPYLHIFRPVWHVLTHAVNSPSSMLRFDDREKCWKAEPKNCSGFVGVVRTDYDESTKKQKTANSYSVLAVERHLWEAGFVNTMDGHPIPVVLNFKSQSSKTFYSEVLLRHYGFIKQHREWYAQQLVQNGEVQNPRIAQVRAQRAITFASMGIKIWRTDRKQPHKGARGVQQCYDPYNHSLELYGNHAQAHKELYCGTESYFENLFPLLHNIMVRPVVAGGLVLEWAHKELAEALKNQEELNPRNDLLFGTHDAPLWMIQQHERAKHGLEEAGNTAATPTSRTPQANMAAPSVAGTSGNVRIEALTRLLQKHQTFFEEHQDGEGAGILVMAEIEAAGEPENRQIEIYMAAKTASAQRYAVLCKDLGISTGGF